MAAGSASTLPLIAGSLSAYKSGLLLPFRRFTSRTAQPVVRTLEGPVTYAAIGASDTIGWGVRDPHRDGWVPTLARHLPQPSKLVNLGIGGTRLREALDQQLPHAVEAQPDLITVWLAVNDLLGGVSLGGYKADLNRLLGELRAKTNAVIAIGNVPYPPAALDPWGFPEVIKRTVAAVWNGTIAEAARMHGAILVDLYRRWPLAQHPEFIGPDGLHPTADGYRTLAESFLGSLREHKILLATP